MSDTPTTPEQPNEAATPPPPAPAPAAPAAPPVAPAKPKSPLALWAMIAGIVAIVSAIVPGLSFVAWIPAIAAIVLGVIALIKKTPRRGQALSGLILGPIAWIVAIVVSIGAIAGLGAGVTDAVVEDSVATEEQQPERAPEPEPEAEPEPEVVAPAADTVYSGSGDTILQIELPAGPDAIGIATMSHSGSRNFVVWSLDENLEQSDLLVNTIGGYSGTVPFSLDSGERVSAFEINADGAWTITLRDVLTVREAPQGETSTGQGDDVLVYRGDATIADVTHSGERNFVIWSYGDGSDLIINDIGPYSGSVRWQAGGALIEVSADGAWSIGLQ